MGKMLYDLSKKFEGKRGLNIKSRELHVLATSGRNGPGSEYEEP
jgi:hypothetical protein